jgi:hypothetical protein
MKASMARLRADVQCRVTYRELVDRPRDTLERIGAFLRLDARFGSACVQSRPRSGPREPEVQAVLPELDRRLRRLGLPEVAL